MSITKNLLFLYILFICLSFTGDSYNKRIMDNREKLNSLVNMEEKIEYLKSNHTLLNGVQLPPFSIADTSGLIISNESFKGKMTLLNFWFIGCPPCIEEMPSLDKIHEIFKEENFEIISVCTDSKSDLEEFLKDHQIPYRVAADGRELLEKVFQWPFGYPSNVLIDEKGKVIKVYRALIESNKKSDYEKFVNEVRNRL